MGSKATVLVIAVSCLILSLPRTVSGQIIRVPNASAGNMSSDSEVNGSAGLIYRLPSGIVPLTYDLRIIPFMEDGNFTFEGNVTIKILVQLMTDTIELHSKGLNVTVHKLMEDGPQKIEIPLESVQYQEEKELLLLKSQMALGAGKTYSISMGFEGRLSDYSYGFYKSSYSVGNGKFDWLATTQFETSDARSSFPCFDEPHLKANFSISIARRRDMNSLSNMGLRGPPVADPNLPPNYVWDHYEETPKMSTYLVAYVVSKFVYKKQKGREFRVWTREEYIEDVDLSLELGPKILDTMQNLTHTEYSLPKMDMICIPDFLAGAMENWGLVTYRESALLYNNGSSSSENKQDTTGIIAHELAHQWFGNLVSPEWWKYTWLSEGFATYFSWRVTELIEPNWRMAEQIVVKDLHRALLFDSMEHQPMSFDVKTREDSRDVFSVISYGKAGSVIRMMEHFLSDRTFLNGIQRYLSSRKFDHANEVQLFGAMDIQAKIESAIPENFTVQKIMSSWSNQAGYPLVTVERNLSNGSVKIKQEMFAPGQKRNGSHTSRWWIPITYTSEKELNFNSMKPILWMKDDDESVLLENTSSADQWVIFNIQQSGFYRVNYDEYNWRLLSNYLNSVDYHKIHPINRAQLIDDSLNLARGGYLKYEIALDLTSYLAHETDYIPWYSAYNGLRYLEEQMVDSEEYEKLKMHLQNLMKNHHGMIDFEGTPDDDHVTRLGHCKFLHWACKYQHENCAAKSLKLFQDWKNSGKNNIPPDFRSTVYCIAISSGGSSDWNYLLDVFRNSTVATEKELIARSLGCTKDKSVIARYLEMSMESTEKRLKHDIRRVFASVSATEEGFEIALDFLMQRFHDILKVHGSLIVRSIIISMSQKSPSVENFEKLKNFAAAHAKDFGGATRALQRAERNLHGNLEWSRNYRPEVESWLQNKYKTSSAMNIRVYLTFTIAFSASLIYF